MSESETYTAFDQHKILASGPLEKVVLKVRTRLLKKPEARILVFSDRTGKEMDFDLRGTEEEVLQKLKVYFSGPSSKTHEGPGRPSLGVVSREVSLLPRHWEWLSTQSGGASTTLRRLVEEARNKNSIREQMKMAQERTYKFLASIAGDFPGYEEALRALFAKNETGFKAKIKDWPMDVRGHAESLSEPVFSS